MFKRIKEAITELLAREVLWQLELNDMEYEKEIMDKLRGD